ncbi:MAG TPA: insulinase family protein, partial [Bacteroidota bacterium]|nr:insulinase family protein [Bacteroidota bacterium]
VEHMAFNGTRSFPKNELVSFLERAGVKLGPDLNASTSFDETVYKLQIPTDSANLLKEAFQILKEWASALTFDDAEIDKERGVVVEEWRLGRGAGERIQNKHNKVLFYNSRYAARLPIGKKEVLDTCSHDALRRFYRDWYRPDLMAVMAVGDFDVDTIKELIKDNFEPLKNPASQRPRPEFSLPDHAQTLVSIATDPELTSASATMLFKRNSEVERTVGDYRKGIVGSLYDEMLNERIRDRLQQPNPPFVYGGTGGGKFVGDKDVYAAYASVKEDSIQGGFGALLSYVFQARDHGFTSTELDRAKKNIMRGMEQAYEEREKTESANYVEEMVRNFVQDEPIPGIGTEYAMFRQLVPSITLEEVNHLSTERITEKNRVITISAPEKKGVVVPAESEILALVKKVEAEKLAAYVDKDVPDRLLQLLPQPGKIESERSLDSIGVMEWKLSNGARVVLKPTDFKNDEILFSAFSNGGLSLAPDSDYLSDVWAASAADLGGIGDLDAIALAKALAGKIVGLSPTISDLTEGFSGESSPRDLEALFQLTYLYFTAPRKDTAAFGAFLTRERAAIANRTVSPEGAFYDTVRVTMNQYHYRARPLTEQMLDSVNLEKAIQFYRERFSDASGFTFFFVGSFSPDSLRPFVERYLASLPALHKEEKWKDIGITPPKGLISKTVVRGLEPKSQVNLIYTGPFEWTRKKRYDFDAMLEYLNIKLREVMREDKSGVYGVSAAGTPSRIPRKEYRITISFGCAPARVEELIETALQQIDSLKKAPPSESYIMKLQELQRRRHEVSLKENRYWLSSLRSAYMNGGNPNTILRYAELVDGLTGAALQEAARNYFDMSNFVRIVLSPEKN